MRWEIWKEGLALSVNVEGDKSGNAYVNET